jgi:hypothetical protein
MDLSEIKPELIGPELGKLKLENTFKEVVYLAPKVYGGITIENKELIKVKGYKNIISFKELKELLSKDSSLALNQELWFKDRDLGTITVKDQVYTLKVTDNKRQLVYDQNGV